ncbi:MAG: hypothetical protein EBT20_19945, partial [Alphaproteobacteria bacterium]|nr:hypothetical protein [Alphaproteobacteria bacterium]
GEGPINDATELYFNDVDQTPYLNSVADLTGNNAAFVNSGPYGLYASAVVGLNGGAGVTRSSFNIVGKTSWTSDCKMTGNAWLGYQLRHNNEVWTNGIPQVRVKVEGRKLYDPRKDSTSSAYDSSLGTTTHRVDDETTWEYSNNSALCILDFLVNAMKVDIEDIDVASIATATEICDEDVTINDANGQSTTQKRYTTNGVAFLDEEVIATVEQLLAPCHGSLVEEGGILRLIVPKDASTVTANITEDDIISELTINVNSEVSNRINKVGGTFIDSANQFQQMDFSPVSSSSLITSDGREHLQQIDLSFVTDEARAQRIASIVLKENALTNSLNLTLKPKFSYLKVGDIVTVTFEPEKLADVGTDSILTTATKWRVASYTLTPEGAVSLALDEYADSSYAWSTADHDYLTRSAVADNFYETGSRPTIGTVSKANHLDENGSQVLGIDVPITHSDHPNLMQSTVFLHRYGYNSTNSTDFEISE